MSVFHLLTVAFFAVVLGLCAAIRSAQLEKVAKTQSSTERARMNLCAGTYDLLLLLFMVVAIYTGGIGIIRAIA
jgi:hypothetical protein